MRRGDYVQFLDYIERDLLPILRDLGLFKSGRLSNLASINSSQTMSVSQIKKNFEFDDLVSGISVYVYLFFILSLDKEIDFVIEDIAKDVEHPIDFEFVVRNLERFLDPLDKYSSYNPLTLKRLIGKNSELLEVENYRILVSKKINNSSGMRIIRNIKTTEDDIKRSPTLYNEQYSALNTENKQKEDIHSWIIKNVSLIEKETTTEFHSIPKNTFVDAVKKYMPLHIPCETKKVEEVWGVMSKKEGRND